MKVWLNSKAFCLSMKQYMPNKPIKRGYKIWARCDSESGYLYAFDIYTGKATSTDETSGGLGYRVVMDLCRNVQPYTLMAFDNFFYQFTSSGNAASQKYICCGYSQSQSKRAPG